MAITALRLFISASSEINCGPDHWRDAGQLNGIFGSNFDDSVRIFSLTEGNDEQSPSWVIKNNFPSLSSGRNALLQSDTHRRWWSIMKSYKHERHAQSASYFYLQTLNEHELVPELFEQAQPCMNSDRKFLYFFVLVSLLGQIQKVVCRRYTLDMINFIKRSMRINKATLTCTLGDKRKAPDGRKRLDLPR